jgi:hypothetical protein
VKAFFECPEDYKKRYELPPVEDPLMNGRRKNRGYLPGKSKEYLKVTATFSIMKRKDSTN